MIAVMIKRQRNFITFMSILRNMGFIVMVVLFGVATAKVEVMGAKR